MTSPDPDPPPPPVDDGRQRADAGRRADARSALAAIDRAVLAGGNRVSRTTHRIRFAALVAGLFAHE